MSERYLQKWAFVAEIVSATVVVLTVAFLVFEMRANTNAIHAQTHIALTEQLNGWRETVSTPMWMDAQERVRAEGLYTVSREDRRRYVLGRLNLWSIYESAFVSHQNGFDRVSVGLRMAIGGKTGNKRRDFGAVCRNQETIPDCLA